MPIEVFPNLQELTTELEQQGLAIIESEEIYREIKWSEDDGFTGETGFIVAQQQ